MARPRKFQDGFKIITFSAPEDLAKKLKDYSEANPGGLSAYICACLDEKISGGDSQRVKRELRTEQEIIKTLKNELSEHEDRAMDLQAQLNEQQEVRQDTTDHRLELLASAVRTGRISDLEKFRSWADAPAGREVLPRCKFPTIEDAYAWMTTDPEAVAWRSENDPRVRKLQGVLQ